MKLRAVTITGADNSTGACQLVDYSKKFPFVEWGILLYRPRLLVGSATKPRYSNTAWLDALEEASRGKRLSLSAHVCGRSVEEITQTLSDIRRWDIFQRIQLNIAKVFHQITDVESFSRYLTSKQEYIVQVTYDGQIPPEQFEKIEREITPQLDLARRLRVKKTNISVFLDPSLGGGKPLKCWPPVVNDLSCGYGGGLGPDNLAAELKRISLAASDATVWVDMETHVRTDDGTQLAFDRVCRCLKIAKQSSMCVQ